MDNGNPYLRGSFDYHQFQQRAQKQAAAVAAHVRVAPTHPYDVAETLCGERQLITLGAHELTAVGLLMASDIYAINERLRTGRSLATGAGVMIDYAGFASMQEFVDEALGVFGALGSSLTLGQPIKLFRGIGIPERPDSNYPDVAGIGAYLAGAMQFPQQFVDAGFGFATTNPEDALRYDGSARGEYPPKYPVLLELEAYSGLCVPQQEHRTAALVGHCFEVSYLSTSTGQVIFEPNTQWALVSICKDSQYGVPLVRMKQL
ncbi:hypothetical protein [Arthrobacter sp. 35W]|uniref:hypothetical protein n=1 Tax=Arthrobacter sp. 35W TaxID=1132441 RepID=UPI00047EBD2B|nr:hypothetical protein [Arthrobacter sp. 35W]